MNKSTIFALIGAGAASVVSLLVGYKIGHERQDYDLTNVGRCGRCIMHLECRTAVSWVGHLMDDHGCSEDDAYTTIDRLYMRIHREEKS
jgi:hypothetical protein